MAKRTTARRKKPGAEGRKKYAFISYRRVDSAGAARWLYSAIQRTFGSSSVFMDTEDIRVADDWPHKISNALQRCTHLIVVIGPTWLRVTDEYNRRRIDRDDDWVRLEIAHALDRGKKIFPVLLLNQKMPGPDALPEAIRGVAADRIQGFDLRDDRWESDLRELMLQLEKDGFEKIRQAGVRYPVPQIHITDMSRDELESALRSLPGWTVRTSDLPGFEPYKRTELSKSFEFPSFTLAMDFVQEVAKYADRVQHHPRWENIWRTVTIWLSTWDIGHKPSQLDVDEAREIERIYERITGGERKRDPAERKRSKPRKF